MVRQSLFLILAIIACLFPACLSVPEAESADGSVKGIAMFGDSITKGGRSWKILKRKDVMNFGVNGATTAELMDEVDAVIEASPELVFVMAGINDVNQERTLEKIVENYRAILDAIRSAGIRIVIQSTLFSSADKPERKEKIAQLNAFLKKYAEEHELQFLDLIPFLCKDHKIRPEYDHDGLHINYEGYLVWGEQIRKQVFDQMGA